MKNKGKVLERKSVEYLEKLGFKVETVKRISRIYTTQAKDFFNLFDHIAVASKDVATEFGRFNAGDVVFIQTKSRKQYGKELEKYKDFPNPNKFIFIWEKPKHRYQLTIQYLGV